MGARLVFFRKTQQQFRLQQGDIYFCVNGKCLGKLAATDCFVDLPAGQYQLQMYYSYAYGSMAGIANLTVNLQEGESLLVRYHMPPTVNQPGNMTLYNYSKESAEIMARELDYQIASHQVQKQVQEQQAQAGARNVALWIILGSVGVSVFLFLFYYLFFMSLF